MKIISIDRTQMSISVQTPSKKFLGSLCSLPRRDLARNEEFSEIAVINIFFTVLKTKTQLSVGGGGVLRGKFRDKSRN